MLNQVKNFVQENKKTLIGVTLVAVLLYMVYPLLMRWKLSYMEQYTQNYGTGKFRHIFAKTNENAGSMGMGSRNR